MNPSKFRLTVKYFTVNNSRTISSWLYQKGDDLDGKIKALNLSVQYSLSEKGNGGMNRIDPENTFRWSQ